MSDYVTWQWFHLGVAYWHIESWGKLVLHSIFFAPKLDITLISVAQFIQDIVGCDLFTKRFCVIHDQNFKTLIGAGEERDVTTPHGGSSSWECYKVSVSRVGGIVDWVIHHLEYYLFFQMLVFFKIV